MKIILINVLLILMAATAFADNDWVINPETGNLDTIGQSSSDITENDARYLKIDGSNANTHIDIGVYNFTTTGTISGINVTSGANPGHTHTGTSLSGIDISDDTNLAVTSPIVLTDDTLSLDFSTNNTWTGTFTHQNASDSTTGFQILDADGGTPIFNVDTTNERVGVGTDSPQTTLHVNKNGDTPFYVGDSTNVAHGMTTLAPTDVYFAVDKWSGTKGGASFTGLSETSDIGGLLFRGISGGSDPSVGVVTFRAGKKNGTTWQNVTGNDVAFSFQNILGNQDYITVLGGGNVGIGTATPATTLDVNGDITLGDDDWIGIASPNNARIIFDSTPAPDNIDFADCNLRINSNNKFVMGGPDGTAVIANLYNSAGDLYFEGDGTRDVKFGSVTNGVNAFFWNFYNHVGIGDVTPDKALEILDTDVQLRLTHTDGVDDCDFEVDTNGLLTITPSGNDISLANAAANIQIAGADPKKSVFVPATAMWPSTTNGCSAITKTELGTNDVDIQTLDFATGADEYAQFSLIMPKNWDAGTITYHVDWTAASGSGTVAWDLQGRSYADSDALDQAWGTAGEALDTLITANDLHESPESGAVTLAGTPAAGEYVHFRMGRDVSQDNLGVDARFIGVRIEYGISQYNDT